MKEEITELVTLYCDKEKERGFASSGDPNEEVCNGVLSKKA